MTRSVILAPRILVAEDDHEMNRLLVCMLEDDGYEVVSVRDGTDLERRIAESFEFPRLAVELIISDIRMPGTTGLEVLRALRHSEWSIPVILITAFGDRETHEEAFRLGAEEVFDKPFDLDDLRAVVWSIVPNHSNSGGVHSAR